MAAWFVPPIVIPIFFAIIIFACALHVIYSCYFNVDQN